MTNLTKPYDLAITFSYHYDGACAEIFKMAVFAISHGIITGFSTKGLALAIEFIKDTDLLDKL